MRGQRRVTQNTKLLTYGVALLSVALALGCSLAFESLIRPIPFSLFFVAVMVSAWYGGFGPGLVATILSTLAINYHLIPPYLFFTTQPESLLRMGVFIVVSLAISGLNQSRWDALRREQILRTVSETAQNEATATKDQLESLLSSISDGFYTVDRNWHLTYVNDRLCEMAGMSSEELLGFCIWELFPEAIGTNAEEELHRAMHEQITVQFNYLHTPWNRWFEHRVYPSPNGLTVFIAEITEHKQAEETLRQTYGVLEQRTVQLEQTNA